MSRAAVIVALVVALALAGVALFLSRQGEGGPPAGPLLAFDPARVVELRVERGGDGAFEAVHRGQAAGDWHVVIGAGGVERSWPASANQMRAALRILSTLEASQAAEPGSRVEPGAARLVVELEDSTARTMRLSSRVLGGKILVEASEGASESRLVWVKSDIGEMLVNTGLKEWRERSAFAELSPETSRVTLRGQQGTVSLARVQGRWGLTEPVAEPADPEAVVRLLTALGSVQITDFLDQGPPERTGLDAPVAELLIEEDRRDAQGHSQVSRQGLKVGQQADIGGTSVFAELISSGQRERRVVVVSAQGLASLSTDWTTYASRRSLQVPAADVGRVRIQKAPGKFEGGTVSIPPGASRAYERTLDGWSVVDDGAAPATLGRADTDALLAFLNLLTQTPADSIRTAPGEGDVRLALVEAASSGGTKVADLEVAVTAQPTAEGNRAWALAVRVGRVWRVYSYAVSRDTIAWLQQ